MTQIKIATKEQISSMRVDYGFDDIKTINEILLIATSVLANKISVASSQVVEKLGKGDFSVPKLPGGEVTYISYDSHVELSFGLEGGAYGGIYKGYLYSFDRLSTKSEWRRFNLVVSQPYEYTVNIPVTSAFTGALGLALVKTVADQPCDNATGKCHAFVYRTRMYPKLEYVFTTDPDRSDLQSGLPTNFRAVDITVMP